MRNTKRNKPFVSGVRPSQARNTEIVSGACEVCGSDEWDTDVVRGETSCAVCGFVAAQNMIDPGACLLYTSPSPRDRQKSRMPSSA